MSPIPGVRTVISLSEAERWQLPAGVEVDESAFGANASDSWAPVMLECTSGGAAVVPSSMIARDHRCSSR